MYCPNCHQKAIKFSRFVFFNPFKRLECICCGSVLETGLFVRFLCVVTFCAVLVSFVYTFPVMHDVIHSQPNKIARFLLDIFLPYIVIPLQVILLFVPVAAYTWIWGKLEIAKAQSDRPGDSARA